MQRRVIGFAGTIASGKSKRIKHLAQLWGPTQHGGGAEPLIAEQHKQQIAGMFPTVAFKIIDADVVGHRCYEPGTATYFKVIEQFGKDILEIATAENQDAPIDRKKLGAIVFASKDRMQELNRIVWPAIAQSIADDIANTEKEILKSNHEGKTTISKTHLVYAVEAAILPHMTDMLMMCDEVWLFHANDEVATKRVMERNKLSEEEATKRVSAQSKMEEKVLLVERAGKKLRVFDTSAIETDAQIEEALAIQVKQFQEMLKEFTAQK